MPATTTSGIARTIVTRTEKRRVDWNERVIHGAKLIELGDLNDSRALTVDETTLEQMIELGSSNKQGLKARFTHPSMSDDGLGKYLGRWRNFRREGDAVLADLHLSDRAFNTPHGNLGQYVMEMAEDEAEMFGVSAAGRFADDMFDVEPGDDDDPDDFRYPIRFKAMLAADVVDSPAATRGGFFSSDLLDPSEPFALHPIATQLLDNHLSSMEPAELLERFRSFLSRYGQARGMDVSALAAKEPSQMSKNTQPPNPDVVLNTDGHQKYVETFGDQGARWFLEGKSFEECLLADRKLIQSSIAEIESEFRDQLAKKDEEIEKLKSDLSEVRKTLGVDPLSSNPPRDNSKTRLSRIAGK